MFQRHSTPFTVIVLLAGLSSFALSGPVTADDEPGRRLEANDFWRLADVSDPRISPDGEWIAYTVSRPDRDSDSTRSRVWMVPAAGGEPLPMTSAEESSTQPRWSPDGRWLAFLSARDDDPAQLWLLNRNGGEAQALTDTPQAIEDYAWSPDGSRLALVLRDLEPAHAAALEAGEDYEEKPEPWVIDRLQFKRDYVGYLDRRRTHLYRFDVEQRRLVQLTGGDYDDRSPVWSPDGEHIAFVSKRVEQPDLSENTDVFRVPAATPEDGVHEPVRVTNNPGSDDQPAWSPDGTRIAHRVTLNPETKYYETPHLAVTPAEGGATRVLTTDLDRWVYGLDFTRDGDALLFTVEDSGEQNLLRVPVSGGAPERLVRGEDVVYGFHQGPEGRIALRLGRPQQPPEVFLYDNGDLEQRTRVNGDLLDGLRLGEVVEIQVDSPDGTRVESFVVKPPGFTEGEARAAILDIHGGPQAQFDWSFDFGAQLMAAQGYLVVQPNPRGSTGRGYDYTLAIWQDWGGPDYEDVMAVVDAVIERGWADPDRLGVMGWSYGGMLTNHVITKTDRFAAAATGASATLYAANYGHDQYLQWWEQELGFPWEPEARAIYERMSPFNRIAEVSTPTLVIGGERDWNVPIVNSEQLYLGLKRLGVETKLIVYPDQYHGIDTPSLAVDLFGRYIDWFGTHLGE